MIYCEGEDARPGATGHTAAVGGELDEVTAVCGIVGNVFPVGVDDGGGRSRATGVDCEELVDLLQIVVVAESCVVGEGVDCGDLIIVQGIRKNAQIIDRSIPATTSGVGIVSDYHGCG